MGMEPGHWLLPTWEFYCYMGSWSAYLRAPGGHKSDAEPPPHPGRAWPKHPSPQQMQAGQREFFILIHVSGYRGSLQFSLEKIYHLAIQSKGVLPPAMLAWLVVDKWPSPNLPGLDRAELVGDRASTPWNTPSYKFLDRFKKIMGLGTMKGTKTLKADCVCLQLNVVEPCRAMLVRPWGAVAAGYHLEGASPWKTKDRQ